MFKTLLETRALRQRRTAGAAFSAGVHLAVISAITAGTVQARPSHHAEAQPIRPVFMRPERQATASSGRPSTGALDAPRPKVNIDPLPRIPMPIPSDGPILPAVSTGPVIDPSNVSIGGDGLASSAMPRSLGLGDGNDQREWRGTEVAMHITRAARPRYPESLRQAGVEGNVLARFTVDTTGRVDMASIVILRESHPLFSRSVRDALAELRFKPAVVNGATVPALAEMPFEFRITNR